MSSQYTLKMEAEKAKEMPMVDLAFEILKSSNTPHYYRDLMMEIAKVKGLSEDQVNDVIAQLYTEINIDGRFACVGTNLWGLKRWYPVEKGDDGMGNAERPRIINDDDDDLDDDDVFGEDEGYDNDDDDDDLDDDDDKDFYDDDDTDNDDKDEEDSEEEIDESIDDDLDEEIEDELDNDLDDADGDDSEDLDDEDDLDDSLDDDEDK
jgi:DNA-directed RNA polymerase subunit delta